MFSTSLCSTWRMQYGCRKTKTRRQNNKYPASGGRTSSSRDYAINGGEIIPKIVFLCRVQLREKKF